MPENVDVKVTYQAKWMWDMTLSLLDLEIQFVDPDTGGILAEGRSYRPSLQRKKPAFMAREVLSRMLSDPGRGDP
ncbi:MAG: hypothetical protein CMJ18_22315 [Phycisphaeraceae bacterium]|nr:hypothetical protein [Phycisphaeraceae bacterium]